MSREIWEILAEADLSINLVGEDVGVVSRLHEISDRYGSSSYQLKNALSVAKYLKLVNESFSTI